jgi:hypothetical protein
MKLLTVLIILTYILFAVLVFILISTAKGERQFFRRIFNTGKRCSFGLGDDFKIVEYHNKSKVKPELLVSISLFGNYNEKFVERYYQPLLDKIDNIKVLLPESQVSVYIANSLKDKVLSELVDRGAEVFVVSPDSRGFEGSMWRFYSADRDIPFICLDSDKDFLSKSYIKDIRKWLKSDKTFIVKRYGLYKFQPLNAQCWGAKPGAFPFIMQEKVRQYCDTTYGVDELFLNKEIWPLMKGRIYLTKINNQEVLIFLSLGLFIVIALTTIVYAIAFKCKKECN